MTDLLVDPRFWGGLFAALFIAFMVVFIVAGIMGRRRPDIVGAVRRRCGFCEDAWAEPATDPYDDLDLCAECREALDAAARRLAASKEEL